MSESLGIVFPYYAIGRLSYILLLLSLIQLLAEGSQGSGEVAKQWAEGRQLPSPDGPQIMELVKARCVLCGLLYVP